MAQQQILLPGQILLTPGMRLDHGLRLAEPIPSRLPTAQWELITPKLAQEWLNGFNIFNRTIKRYHIKRLASDMTAGRWRGTNGQTIAFDVDGRLADGQQRLNAVVASGMTVLCLVVRDVPNDCYPTIGIGSKKTVADTLQPFGVHKNTTLLQSTCRMVLIWLDGNLAQERNGDLVPTDAQIISGVDALTPELDESVNWVASHQDVRAVLIPTVAAFIHYAGTQTGHPDVSTFLERVGDGLGLNETSPAYHLRRFLLANKSGKKKSPRSYIVALTIKAWNYTLAERPMRALMVRADEGFPVLEAPASLIDRV